ncbi:unnamed protein product [Medioppia subpectinata]|uniref:RWD domain-containing protein n=1 Tax=Medioppia subpectinata TaxID=1979941 RepID=A0A7R9PTG6_9ACAR|nr:unnamed protein product [Medioppia subpectinata]CAG2100609.1 unnamed protein product [Medioppia subpectinata]
MNYPEEQSNELEALEAIYTNELTVISRTPYHKFTIDVKSDPQMMRDDSNDETVCDTIYAATIQFKFPDTYPDCVPEIEIPESDNLDDSDERELLELLETEAANGLGMVMTFTLVSVAIDWINRMSDKKATELKDTIDRKRRAEEEAEHKKFEGTIVTVETFMTWKAKYDEELRALDKTFKARQELSKRLTGKQLFINHEVDIDSDLRLLDEGDQDIDIDVKVDESLFQDMDELDLDEDVENER